MPEKTTPPKTIPGIALETAASPTCANFQAARVIFGSIHGAPVFGVNVIGRERKGCVRLIAPRV